MESCRKHGIWGPLEAGDRRDTGLGELCVSVRFWPSAPQHWTWECSGRNHNNAVPIAFLHTKHPVLYRNVYSTTYVGHMQTNKLTTLKFCLFCVFVFVFCCSTRVRSSPGLLSGRVFLRSQCESLGRDTLQEHAMRWKSFCPKV